MTNNNTLMYNSLENINDKLNDIDKKRGRGRPRKNQINLSVSDGQKKKNTRNNETTDNMNDDIILHIPITSADINKYKNIFQIEEKCVSPSTNGENNVFTINDMSSDESSSDNTNHKVKELLMRLRDYEKKVSIMENEISEYKKMLQDEHTMSVNNKNIYKTNVKFITIEENGVQDIVENTDIACWWCTHNFEGIPCVIPEKLYNETYYVFGCFCCVNCAAKYISEMNDYNAGNRYCLLKKLYNMANDNNNDIPLAPDRRIFKKFGGILTYDDYRKNCHRVTKEFRYIMPPMMSIVPYIEESTKNNNKLIKYDDNNRHLVLKRSKPLPNSKTSLFETMGIKIN